VPFDVPALYRDATTVLHARVTEVSTVKNPNPGSRDVWPTLVRAKFEVREVMKGQSRRIPYVESAPPESGNCGLPLAPNVDYVFFMGLGLMTEHAVTICSARPIDPSNEWGRKLLRDLRKLKGVP
jgi:hypothetical protein